MFRFSSFLCGGLFLGSLAPVVTAQDSPVTPEVFRCPVAALPRLIGDLKSPDAKVRERAIVTLGSLGPVAKPAAPALIEVAVNTRGHVAALQALAKIDDEATRAALRRLLVGGVGRCRCGFSFADVVVSAGEPIVPQLLVMLPEKEFTATIESVLFKIGAPAVPHLIEKIGDAKTPRLSLYRVLSALRPVAKSATPALEACIRFESISDKMRRAQTLMRVNGSHPWAFDLLHHVAKTGAKAERDEAIECLNLAGCKQEELIPTMVAFLTADDAGNTGHAMNVLSNIGPAAVPALLDYFSVRVCKSRRELREAAAKTSPKHTDRVVHTLRFMGPKAAGAIGVVSDLLDSRDPKLAILAAETLPDLGPDAKVVVPHLIDTLKIDDPALRLACAASIARIDRQQIPHTIAAVVAVLRGKNADQKYQALSLLQTFGKEARSGTPALVEFLATEPLAFRVRVAVALNAIDATQLDVAMPTLIEAIQLKPDRSTRATINTAMHLLQTAGPRAKAAVPVLLKLLPDALKNPDDQIDGYTIVALLNRIDSSADVLPIMIAALNSEIKTTRQEAMYLVEDHFGVRAVASLDAALANGQLRTTPEMTNLLKRLRPQAKGSNQQGTPTK